MLKTNENACRWPISDEASVINESALKYYWFFRDGFRVGRLADNWFIGPLDFCFINIQVTLCHKLNYIIYYGQLLGMLKVLISSTKLCTMKVFFSKTKIKIQIKIRKSAQNYEEKFA